jgi:biopolymer transport protein TolQ
MNVSQDLSILHLILNASAVVQAVMLLLAGVSFMSWYYIFRKWFTVKAARAQTEQFERDFWSGGDLNSLYQSAINNRHSTGSMERIFEAGFREFTKLRSQKNLDPKDVIDGSRRAMRATYQREMDSIDSHLAFLASVGSVSPYVGLFGTVWGIMHSFRGLVECRPGDARRGCPGDRRSVGGHGHRPVCGDSGGGRLQPLRARDRPSLLALRVLHGRVLEHPATADEVRPCVRAV